MRFVVALALGFSLVALTGVATTTAQEKKTEDKKAETKTLEGKMVCGKCKLSETEACSNVLIVKEGGKEINYYLTDKGKGEKYHKCTGEAAVKVTGKVAEKDGKKTITDAKVEAVK